MLHEPIYHEMYRMGELERQEVGSCKTGEPVGGAGSDRGQASPQRDPLG